MARTSDLRQDDSAFDYELAATTGRSLAQLAIQKRTQGVIDPQLSRDTLFDFERLINNFDASGLNAQLDQMIRSDVETLINYQFTQNEISALSFKFREYGLILQRSEIGAMFNVPPSERREMLEFAVANGIYSVEQLAVENFGLRLNVRLKRPHLRNVSISDPCGQIAAIANTLTVVGGSWALGGLVGCVPCAVGGGLLALGGAVTRLALMSTC